MASLVDEGNQSDEASERPASSASWASSTSWAATMVLDAGRRIVSGPLDELQPHWDVLSAGDIMQLHSEKGVEEVQISLSSDRAMLTWRAAQSGASGSGVVALSTVKTVSTPAPGWFSAPGPGEFVITAEMLEVRLDAGTSQKKAAWVEAIRATAEKAAQDRDGRKIGHETRRMLDLEMKRREAERRKAETMKGLSGGMKHTAKAMLSR